MQINAKIIQRTNTDEERTELSSVIPLEAPYVIMIDPSSACNLKCLFCPTGDKIKIAETKRFQGYMKPEVYNKIINDISLFKAPIKTLRLYKEGDPLVNPFFPEFVKIAKKNKNILKVDTTTNGVLLNNELSNKIIASGIDQINISINGLDDEKYQKLTNTKVNFKSLLKNIEYLYKIRGNTLIYVKAIEENLNDNEKKIFFELFGNISDRIFLERLQPNWPGFSFNYVNVNYTIGHYGQSLQEREVCPFIFYMMVINADGRVSSCVQDWRHELIVGDSKIESLLDIWSGEPLNKMRIQHLRKKRCENDTCSICPVLKHGCLDNIDSHAESILKKLLIN